MNDQEFLTPQKSVMTGRKLEDSNNLVSKSCSFKAMGSTLYEGIEAIHSGPKMALTGLLLEQPEEAGALGLYKAFREAD